MEFFTLLVSGALGLVTPVGLVVDQAAVGAIRSQLAQVEQLQVRVDNAPTHQLLQGKVERVRVAGAFFATQVARSSDCSFRIGNRCH
jgi:hypothetical protein